MQSAVEIAASLMSSQRRRALKKAIGSATCRDTALTSLAGSSAALLLAEIAADTSLSGGHPLLVIAADADDAGYIYHDMNVALGSDGASGSERVLYFPSGYKRHIRYGQPDAPSQILRTEALNAWHASAAEAPLAVVTYPEALAEQVARREELDSHTIRLERGREYDMTELVHRLRDNGFVEHDYVYEPGQFALRGSILDIFGYSNEQPLRIDFFGDEIDSIRLFNVETQLSEQRLDAVSITAGIAGSSASGVSLLEYIDADTLIAVRAADMALDTVRRIGTETMSDSAMIAGEGDLRALDSVVDADTFAARFATFRKLHFTAARESTAAATTIDFDCSPQALYHKNFDLISDSFKQFIGDGYTIYILSDSERQFDRLKAIFDDRRDDIRFTPVMPTVHEGFVDHAGRRCVFTDHQIFDRFHKYNLRSDRARSGRVALSLKELGAIEPGDYIVHVDHGVGKFAGLLRTAVNGHPQEMIKLVYANNDTIFVSIHALHKLAKYRGKEGVPPKINKLGTGAWARMKERTKDKLKDIARDLIKLYAARLQERGHAFAPDSFMQHELEASFIYEDTPDQLTATQAVKADMESERPMDRLICGDVGFGKTEVAIRAAFKAASDGKQTAVLVPTTVLAYQHYNTFRERLKDFPVRVEYLSRARTAKQTSEILRDLADGNIDILIGTHKIVGKNVKFKDLGLLVIDEEQKFGVAVKEKLKQMRTNVDTLTMSATPIPRTLQFSLMGARDLSAITTPPANRYPILTSVNALTDNLVAEAINFELSRNGQVFIVNPRIEGLYELESMVKRLVPDARTVVAHGQMPPDKLEKTIIDFADHDYDVLLATTIIESGIDMPNVNTIMINNAQNFGLSELHQLRGRVGRSSRKAFCYLMVPPHVPLSPVGRRRLQAIESFSDLGSGIHIAMQDLDIRGAGNLLGAEQSGFIADLGYETYQKILREAVHELRSEEFADLPADPGAEAETEYAADCVIESDMELLFPATYVPQESERIALYQELDSLEREADIIAFSERLTDRFGKIPAVAAELLRVPRLRRMARRLGIEKVALKQGVMYLYFVDETNVAYYQSDAFGRLVRYTQEEVRRVRIRQTAAKRSFAIADVGTVAEAVRVLDHILSLPPL